MVPNINELLGYTLDNNASDLHLSVGSVPMVRVHGEMQKLQLPTMDKKTMESIMVEVLNENQIERFMKNLEIDFSAKLQDRGRFRVNFFHQLSGYSAVFRAIPTVVLSSEELGVPPLLNQLAMKDRGLILLTGPTGSGKSTTLAAMIDHVNEKNNNNLFDRNFYPDNTGSSSG